MSEQQVQHKKAVLELVDKYLTDAMNARSSAEIKFAVQLTEGGVRDKWVETKVKAK